MAYDPCAPFPEPGTAASAAPRHHVVHHVIGRIRHRTHHVASHAAHPHVVLADSCSKPVGALPALPGGRPPTLALLGAAPPTGAMLGGKALAAAAVVALAGAVGVGVATVPHPSTPRMQTTPIASVSSPGGAGTPVIIPQGTSTPTPSPVSVPEPPSVALLALAATAALGARRLLARPARA